MAEAEGKWRVLAVDLVEVREPYEIERDELVLFATDDEVQCRRVWGRLLRHLTDVEDVVADPPSEFAVMEYRDWFELVAPDDLILERFTGEEHSLANRYGGDDGT